MAAQAQSRFWRRARRTFRWFRIASWLVILALLVLFIWLHRVGLPDFLKDSLVVALRERGIDLQFTRMRLIWYRGIVAENIHFGKSGDPLGLRASAQEAELHLRLRSLLRRNVDVQGIGLHRGHLTIPVWGTNDQPRQLEIQKVSGELRFLPGDRWDLGNLTAEVFGVTLKLRGSVANASAVRTWRLGPVRPKERTPQAFWHDVVRQFEQTTFQPPTEIAGHISGDAREMQTFRANISITSPAIDSPWGRGQNVQLSAQVSPQPGTLVHALVKLQATQAETRWGGAEFLELDAQIAPSLTQWAPTNAHVNARVKRARTPWGNSAALAINVDFRPNPSDATSALADYSVRGQQIQTPWARLAQAELAASGVVSASNAWPSTARTTIRFAAGEVSAGRAASGTLEASLELPPVEAMQFGDTNISWWSRLDRVAGDWHGRLNDVNGAGLEVKQLSWKGAWRAPTLKLTELEAQLYDGTLVGAAELDAGTRLLAANVKTDFDPRKAASVLDANGQRWLRQFGWEKPPRTASSIRVTLPSWTNHVSWRAVDWRNEVLPTLSLAGSFQVGAAQFQSVPVLSAQSDFTYSNRTWTLPNLHVARPEGQAHISHVAHELTREYRFVVDSSIDPRALRPLFETNVQHILDDFTITSPPRVRAEISGFWHEPKQISFRATLAITNAGFRGQPVLEARSLITMTNLIISCLAPEAVRTEGAGRADSVIIDVPRMKLFINNATGRMDPGAITRMIGEHVAEIMEPYRFIGAPTGRAHGMVDLEDGLRSDLRFEAAGGPFEWRAFRFQQITGVVHWAGTTLTLSNVIGSMHGGLVESSARFNFDVPRGADFAFRALVHDINLHSLAVDLGNPTNKLEGSLAGLLVVTNANSEELGSWFGYGNMSLRDGLFWDVPVFGLFSPILNSINPGAGNSRAREATATFLLTNSVIFTSDLLIFASGMRLHYDGTVDFDTRINGRMEAELFRDMPGLGQVVSKVFWPVTKLFEYKVTGTFSKPKSEPVFIPKVFLMPFHPLRTLRELLEENKDELPRRTP